MTLEEEKLVAAQVGRIHQLVLQVRVMYDERLAERDRRIAELETQIAELRARASE